MKKRREAGGRVQIAAKIKIKTKEFPKNLQLFYLTFLSSKVETEGQAELASYVNLICTPLSLAGTFYMIHSYFKDYTRSFSSRLIFCLPSAISSQSAT